MIQLIVLSGPICAGKTCLADALEDYELVHVLSRELLMSHCGIKEYDRVVLQKAGEALEENGNEDWYIEPLRNAIINASIHGASGVCWDAVRSLEQVSVLHERFVDSATILHVHLTAHQDTLEERYWERGKDTADYTAVKLHRYENPGYQSRLAVRADVVLNTDRLPPSRLAAVVRLCI